MDGFSFVRSVLLSSILRIILNASALQNGEVELENRSSILMFSSDEEIAKSFTNKTWLPHYAATNNDDLIGMSTESHQIFSLRGSKSKSRQRRNAERTDARNLEYAYEIGDYNLGGMFAVHYPNRDDPDPNPCSRVQTLTGLRIESMLYAIDSVNNRTDILPGVKLGFEIRDDCSDQNQALREALSFITMEDDETCSNDEPQTIGVVGTGSSVTSDAVANLLGLFKVPQVSYSASSPLLSNKNLYPYFARTIASDINQVAVMADFAEEMGWNYVAIIYTDDTYGQPGMEHLSELLQAKNICIAHLLSLSVDSPDWVVVEIVETIKKDSKVSVIFTFCLKHDIDPVLKEAHTQHLFDRTWIASDSWSNSIQTIEGLEPVVTGMLGVVPKSSYDENFNRYLSKLVPTANYRNPWYKLTLSEQFNCSFDLSDNLRKPCTGLETFANISDTNTQFVIDAVYAFAYGLHNMMSSNCSNCRDMDCLDNPIRLDLECYLGHVKSVNFSGLTNSNFMFDENGDPMAEYELHNLQQDQDKYYFANVANWDPTAKFSKWKDIVWKNGRVPPLSRCSQDCPAGHFITLQNARCCWNCHECQAGSISFSNNSVDCTECLKGQKTNDEKTNCIDNPIIFLEWRQPTAIVLLILTGLGLLATGFTLVVYIRHRNSATIKATSTELSYMLLIGIALSYTCTVLFIAKPNNAICNAKIFMVGTSFSVYVSALLTKTNRISRIFNRKLSDGSPSMFLNIQYQLMFALGIVAVQIILQVIWLQLEPGLVVKNTSNPEITLLECQYSSYLGIAVAIALNAVLALLCLYKAFRIRKLPGQFNDSRGICFAMLTCCLIWFVFFASYFTTNGQVNSIICSLAFVASGTSGLICMFLPKIWIVIMRPDLNIHQSTMSSNLYSTNSRIPSVSGNVATDKMPQNGQASLAPSMTDLSLSPSNSLDAEWDNISQPIDDEEEEQRFIEDIGKMEKDLKEAGKERDDAVAMANQMYEEMMKLQKIQDEEVHILDDKIQTESITLEELLRALDEIQHERASLTESLQTGEIEEEGKENITEEMDDASLSSDNDSGLEDKEISDESEKVNELAVKLETALADRDKLTKKVKGLELECQHWKNIPLNGNQDTANISTHIENTDNSEDSYV